MSNQTTTEFDLKNLAPELVKQIAIWGPIVVGIVHQLLMYFFGIEAIYVFVNPPGSIRPQVSLEYEWWFVLALVTGFVCLAAYSNRSRGIPSRIAIPTYIYLLFLLILVKPV